MTEGTRSETDLVIGVTEHGDKVYAVDDRRGDDQPACHGCGRAVDACTRPDDCPGAARRATVAAERGSTEARVDEAIRRLAEIAAPHCGGGEDWTGALVYVGFPEAVVDRLIRGAPRSAEDPARGVDTGVAQTVVRGPSNVDGDQRGRPIQGERERRGVGTACDAGASPASRVDSTETEEDRPRSDNDPNGVKCDACGKLVPRIKFRPLDGQGRCEDCSERGVPYGAYLRPNEAWAIPCTLPASNGAHRPQQAGEGCAECDRLNADDDDRPSDAPTTENDRLRQSLARLLLVRKEGAIRATAKKLGPDYESDHAAHGGLHITNRVFDEALDLLEGEHTCGGPTDDDRRGCGACAFDLVAEAGPVANAPSTEPRSAEAPKRDIHWRLTDITDHALGPMPTMPIEALLERLEKAAPRIRTALANLEIAECADEAEDRETIGGIVEERTNDASRLSHVIEDLVEYVKQVRRNERARSRESAPHHRAIGGRPTTCASADEQIVVLGREVERLTKALSKLNEIRNSIVGVQGFNFSEHAYPMVAALNEAGFEGLPYPEARANVGTLIERATEAEESDPLDDAERRIRALWSSLDGWCPCRYADGLERVIRAMRGKA